jgi:hypothetical protein
MTPAFPVCNHPTNVHLTNVVSLDSYRHRRSAPDDDVPPRPGPLAAWPVRLQQTVDAIPPRPRARVR